MFSVLHYGVEASIRLELADGALVAECGRPRAARVEQPDGAVLDALAEPLNYPPLASATTPGDRVVVALAPSVPQGACISAAVVKALVAAGVQADGITVLRTGEDARAGRGDPYPFLASSIGSRISLATHQPESRGQLAYLAANQRGEPILLSRALVDADVVIPVGCWHRRMSAGYYGVHTPIYPTFSDPRTLARFRAAETSRRWRLRHRALVREASAVGWLLGVTFTVQVIPGPGEQILHVLAGEVSAVRRRARQLYHEEWHWTVDRPADLVVAALEGGPGQQTWWHVGRALDAARALVEPGGAIAICSALADPPGPAVRHLAAARSRREAIEHIRRQQMEDAIPAVQWARALSRAEVYLLSDLDPQLVEDLGAVPVEPDGLDRLVRRRGSCILLANAAHASVRVAHGHGR